MFGWMRSEKKPDRTEVTPTPEERRIIAAVCNFGRHHPEAYELSREPVRFTATCGIIITTLWNRRAGDSHESQIASGYGVTVRESLLSLLTEINPKAAEQFAKHHGTDADSTAGSENEEDQTV